MNRDQKDFWKALSSAAPPNYDKIEAQGKETIKATIKRLEQLPQNDYSAASRKYTNREMIEFHKRQLESYTVVRKDEITNKELDDNEKNISDMLRKINFD